MSDLVKKSDVQEMAEKSEWFESSESFNEFITALYNLPSAEPKKVLVAEVKLSQDQIQSAIDEAAEKIKAEMEEQERKKGKWIGKEQFANSPEYYSWQCSVCGAVLEDPTLDKPYPFCPICGSHNTEKEGEEE